jgi:hypothetical protein
MDAMAILEEAVSANLFFAFLVPPMGTIHYLM